MKKNASILYCGKEYELIFNINVMDEIQQEYVTMAAWQSLVDGSESGEPNLKALKFAFTRMINEALNIAGDSEQMTEREVGRMISAVGLDTVVDAVQTTIIDSTADKTEKNA